jgi:hypothetical protein
MATCQQPGNKYDLEKVKDYPNEPLCDYIHYFSEIWISIPGPRLAHGGKKSGQMLTRLTSRSRRMSGELLILSSKIVAMTTA